MTNEERNEYVNYRIETARNTLDAAKVLAENGFWNSSVNRLKKPIFICSQRALSRKLKGHQG